MNIETNKKGIPKICKVIKKKVCMQVVGPQKIYFIHLFDCTVIRLSKKYAEKSKKVLLENSRSPKSLPYRCI